MQCSNVRNWQFSRENILILILSFRQRSEPITWSSNSHKMLFFIFGALQLFLGIKESGWMIIKSRAVSIVYFKFSIHFNYIGTGNKSEERNMNCQIVIIKLENSRTYFALWRYCLLPIARAQKTKSESGFR